MDTPFYNKFSLKDGTQVEVRQEPEGLYNFQLFFADGGTKSFTWNSKEPKEQPHHTHQSPEEQKMQQALKELWKVL